LELVPSVHLLLGRSTNKFVRRWTPDRQWAYHLIGFYYALRRLVSMVSEYLKTSYSIKELDALFERDRLSAAKIAKTLFDHEVSTAISNIGKINQIANARILAESQISSAKLMTDAEVTATLLLSKAEIAVLEIQHQSIGVSPDSKAHRDNVGKINRSAAAVISTITEGSVQKIHREAEDAIAQLKGHAKKSIEEIQALADEISVKVKEAAQVAKAKLSEAKSHPRLPEDVAEKAEADAMIILDEAARATQRLHDASARISGEVNAIVDQAALSIVAAVNASEGRLSEACDKALSRIHETAVLQVPD